MKIYTIAHLPQHLVQAWLQHLRDFDTAHPECLFRQVVEPSEQAEMGAKFDTVMEMLRLDPPLPVNIVRKKH